MLENSANSSEVIELPENLQTIEKRFLSMAENYANAQRMIDSDIARLGKHPSPDFEKNIQKSIRDKNKLFRQIDEFMKFEGGGSLEKNKEFMQKYGFSEKDYGNYSDFLLRVNKIAEENSTKKEIAQIKQTTDKEQLQYELKRAEEKIKYYNESLALFNEDKEAAKVDIDFTNEQMIKEKNKIKIINERLDELNATQNSAQTSAENLVTQNARQQELKASLNANSQKLEKEFLQPNNAKDRDNEMLFTSYNKSYANAEKAIQDETNSEYKNMTRIRSLVRFRNKALRQLQELINKNNLKENEFFIKKYSINELSDGMRNLGEFSQKVEKKYNAEYDLKEQIRRDKEALIKSENEVIKLENAKNAIVLDKKENTFRRLISLYADAALTYNSKSPSHIDGIGKWHKAQDIRDKAEARLKDFGQDTLI